MPQNGSRAPSASDRKESAVRSFLGFEPIEANFLYCPNQFFDVCLPNCSRGVVRLVAFLLRKTLGWLDEEGNPLQENVAVSYAKLIEQAGISRGAIRPAVDEAIAAGFINCLQAPKAKAKNGPAQSALFTLRWDGGSRYTKDPRTFGGFYAGEGHRSPIPNAFVDILVPRESLAVVKVVGTVLRHTVGYQNQFGGRRSRAPLSYSFIQKYANVRNRTTLNRALQHAIGAGYIVRTSEGTFDPDASNRRAAEYAVKWQQKADFPTVGSKSVPVRSDRSEKRTSIGTKTGPAGRFKKGTEEKTDPNDTCKQPVVAAENRQGYALLREQGIDERKAAELSSVKSAEEIQRQIAWLPLRKPTANPGGMLIRAIQGDWDEPPGARQADRQRRTRERDQRQQADQATKQAHEDTALEQKRQRRATRLAAWQAATEAQRHKWLRRALDRAANSAVRRSIQRRAGELADPPREALEAMAAEVAPAGESPAEVSPLPIFSPQ